VTVLAILSVWCAGLADPVPADEAGAAAHQFISQESARGDDYLRVVGLVPTTRIAGLPRSLVDPSDGSTLGYVYGLSPVGFVVVTPETWLPPIIAFSYESNFSWEEDALNILLHMLRSDLALRLSAIDAGAVPSERAASNESEWSALVSPPRDGAPGDDPDRNGTIVYGPWLTSAWSQGAPWYNDCPIDPATTERCVVGCVATALAQILNYWQYPTSVTFTAASDYTTFTKGIVIDASTADFGALNYNGCDPDAAAMAALSYAAGVSVQMDYESIGSGAFTSDIPRALCGGHDPWGINLPQVWGYASAHIRTHQAVFAWYGAPYYTTESSFYDQMATDMTLARPVEIAITASGADGHAIVVDGWQSGGRIYHLNFGWGGFNNSWYTLPAGMPSGYNIIDDAIMNIVPTATNHTLATSTTGSGTVSHLPTSSTLTAGTHVLVTATPDIGSTFSHWEGAASGSDNPVRVIMDANKTVTAVFNDPSDTTPPTPDPMTWNSPPSVTGATTISMTATTATDPGGVEYYFDETTGNPGATDSGWQDSATYADAGLNSNTQYCYRVRARDKSANQNTTGWSSSGCATTGPPATASRFRVKTDGTVLADGTVYAASFQTGSADVAEWAPVSEPVEPGDVVEFDPLNPGSYRLCSDPCSARVAGVIATEPGMILGEDTAGRRAVLALIGIVPVKVTDEGGPIAIGDLLVSSLTPGHAKRWSGSGPCALVGKALEPMIGDHGVILVLLTAH